MLAIVIQNQKHCQYVLPLWCLVPVAQMSTVRQVKTHEPVMGPHDGLVNLQVRWATTQALDVDTPLLCVETECLKSTLLAEQLNGINVFVATVVAGTRVTLGVFVGHGRTKGIEDSAGGYVLRGDEEDGLALTLDFLLLLQILEMSLLMQAETMTYHDLSDLIVGVHQGLLHELC